MEQKRKKTPSPSPESPYKDPTEYEIPKDLPSPEKYTVELMKKDEKYVDAVMNKFYNKNKPHAAINKLKEMKTATKAERLKKKISLVKAAPSLIPVLPKAVEDTIFREINKRIQVELDNYDAMKKIRDEKFEIIIDKLKKVRDESDDVGYAFLIEKINNAYALWKPEDSYELDHLETAIYGEDPFVKFQEAKEQRIRYVEEYIRDSWNEGWRKAKKNAVEEKEKTPNSGRKLTDILIEDWLVPRCVDKYYGATYDLGYDDYENSEETYMIDEWNDAWIEADKDEYQKSDEYQEDIEKQMKKTNKDRTTVITELNQNIKEEQKLIRDAEENEKRKIAAAEETRKRETEVNDRKKKSRETLRKRSLMKKAMAEAALRPKTPAQKQKVGETTEMLPEPPAQKVRATTMPPAAGDGPTPMAPTEPSPISYTDAQKLANENEHIIIVQSKSNPGKSYMFNNETKVSTWIIENPASGLHQSIKTPGQYYSINKQGTAEWLGTTELSRVDAENAVQNNPGRFEIRTDNTPDGNFDYLINKETDAVAKIFD